MNKEIINYKHIKESLELILLLYLPKDKVKIVLEQLDDATANNLTYLQTQNKSN